MRVVTLVPSATEIVYALGLEPVGVSHECDYPPDATEKPAVNFSYLDSEDDGLEGEADSQAINEAVLEAEREHGSVYGIDIELLDLLDPDLIVTQGVCDVCAVDSVLVEAAVDGIDADPAVLTTDPHSLADVLEDVRRIGAATDREAEAESVVASLTERVDAVERIARGATDRPRVAVLDWLDPVMVAGHWVPEMVETAGGRYGLADPGNRSEPREWADVRAYDPEVLVAAPCGFGLDRTAGVSTELTDHPGYDHLAAVRAGRAWAMDGHHYVNRPGPRLVDTLEHLAGIVHPDLFDEPPQEVALSVANLAAERPTRA